jgi:AraC family transcriptional regulator
MEFIETFIADYPQLPNWAGALLPTGAALLGDFDFLPHEILIPSLEFDEIYVPRSITQQAVYIGINGQQTRKVIYSPGDAVLRPAGEAPVHLTWPDGNSANVLYIDPALYMIVGQDLLCENVRGVELCSNYHQHNPKLAKQVQRLYYLARNSNPLAVEACLYALIRNILSSHLAKQVQHLPAMERSSPALFQQVRTLINENLDSKITLAYIAETLDISLTRLTMQFRNTTGITVHEYVLQVRLRKANQLLLKTDKSLSDIAFEVGFSSQAHLTTAYKQYYGLTPLKARNQHKQ